jgi:plasmid stabilization system protein ParE
VRIGFTDQALSDLGAIADYLDPVSPQGRRSVGAAIRTSIENLALFPRMGRLQTVPRVRKIAAGKYPYWIYYTVDDAADEVVIIAIQHASRARPFTER